MPLMLVSGVAHLVGDAGGEQAEGRHLLLVKDVGLRLLQLRGALGDAALEVVVEAGEVVADALEQRGEGGAGPGDPAEHDQGEGPGEEAARRGRQGEEQRRPAEAVQGAGSVGDPGRVAHGAAQDGEEIVVAERAGQPGVAEAEQADEQGLHEGDGQGIAPEEDLAAQAVPGVEQGVDGPQRQDGVEQGEAGGVVGHHVDDDIADQQAEPADLDGDGLGGQLPGRGGHETWGSRGVPPHCSDGRPAWARRESNPHLSDYESGALTVMLQAHGYPTRQAQPRQAGPEAGKARDARLPA